MPEAPNSTKQSTCHNNLTQNHPRFNAKLNNRNVTQACRSKQEKQMTNAYLLSCNCQKAPAAHKPRYLADNCRQCRQYRRFTGSLLKLRVAALRGCVYVCVSNRSASNSLTSRSLLLRFAVLSNEKMQQKKKNVSKQK